MIHAPVLEAANDYREFKGRPVVATSACRCLDHNKAVGGHPQSYHQGRYSRNCTSVLRTDTATLIVQKPQLAGYAIDLACPAEEQEEAREFFENRETDLQVFLYPDKGFVHINGRPAQ